MPLPQRGQRPFVVGMIHLDALPGAPRFGGDLGQVLENARRDAQALLDGGLDAIMLENYHDTPFFPRQVPSITVATMTRCALAVREVIGALPLGVNVLRNDGTSALSIAEAVGADFIRVNVLTGAAVTDQGLIEADAATLLRTRAHLGSQVSILADLQVKHAKQLGPTDLQTIAQDTVLRAHADGLILSGAATGAPTDYAAIDAIRHVLPNTPMLVGSGVSPDHLPPASFDGMIVGTWLKTDGRVNVERSRQLMAAVDTTA